MTSRMGSPRLLSHSDLMDGVANHNRHPSIIKNSIWGTDPSFLWNRSLEYMNSGKPLKLVWEAAIIPYHVQSYAQ